MLNLLHLGEEIIFSHKRIIEENEYNLGVSEKYHTYRFEIPWLSLNSNNYKRYKEASGEGYTLRRILIEIYCLSKAFDYTVNERIECALNLTKTVNYKTRLC